MVENKLDAESNGGPRFKMWIVSSWRGEDTFTCGTTRAVHEVMRRDVRGNGTMTACGWTVLYVPCTLVEHHRVGV